MGGGRYADRKFPASSAHERSTELLAIHFLLHALMALSLGPARHLFDVLGMGPNVV